MLKLRHSASHLSESRASKIHWVDFDILKKFRNEIVNSQKEKNIISPIRKENDCTPETKTSINSKVKEVNS